MGCQCHTPAALPSAKTRYSLYRRLGGPQGRYGQVRKISLPPVFDPRTVQPVAILCTYYSFGDRGFKSHWAHGCLLCLLCTVQVVASATSWSLNQRGHTVCFWVCVCVCVHVCLYMCVCVCVCVRERERSRNLKNEAVSAQVRLLCYKKILFLILVMLQRVVLHSTLWRAQWLQG